MFAIEKIRIKYIIMRVANLWFLNNNFIAGKSISFLVLISTLSLIFFKDSGKKNIVNKKAMNEKAALANPVTSYPYFERNPPMIGPNTNPKPKATPIIPIPLERSSFDVTSAIYA